jgi:hypothetical protein
MRMLVILAVLTLAAGAAAAAEATTRAAATPLDTPIPDGGNMEIEVVYDGPTAKVANTTFHAQPGTYKYSVNIPADYSKDPKRHYPCIFINYNSYNGLGGWFAADKWIVIRMDSFASGPWEPIVANFLAVHDDAMKRLRIMDGMKFATGFSAGSRGASEYCVLRPGFAGLLQQGAGFGYYTAGHYYGNMQNLRTVAFYGIFGDKDSNRFEIADQKKELKGARQEFVFFPGGHAEAPPENSLRGLDWLERSTFLDQANAQNAKKLAPDFFRHRYETLSAKISPLRKFEMLQFLHDIAAKHDLAKDKDLKDKVDDVNKQLADATKDETVQKEAKAKEAYFDAQKKEIAIRDSIKDTTKDPKNPKAQPPPKGPPPPKPLDPAATDAIKKNYQTIIDTCPDTEFAKLAATRLENVK